MLHVFRKYQLLVKILRTKLTRQVVYKVAFAMKYPHPNPNEHNLHTQIWSERHLSKNRIIRPNSHAKIFGNWADFCIHYGVAKWRQNKDKKIEACN